MTIELKAKPQTKQLIFYCWKCHVEGKPAVSIMNLSMNIRGNGTIKAKCPEGHWVTAPMNQNIKMCTALMVI